ncbi:fimbria/pilus outer membrane usher protein [Piscinibacter sp.]|uniref:fimbria/pilus outer membrane usher protein n=1 Tax=Piscinibacter sp. TaxID=1903157 RepID=UPI002BE35562|nr:fimbria/pilus outer membrane usher protein [Albitalea sp.]HUG24707.1 fimbria/pilus outer membrane usher protein [Albitalea sp.]
MLQFADFRVALPCLVTGACALSPVSPALADSAAQEPHLLARASAPTLAAFDASMLVLPGVDVSRYAVAAYFPPGVYLVDVVLNDRPVAKEEVRFLPPTQGAALQPCLSAEQIARFGIAADKVPARDGAEMAARCDDVFSAIESSSAHFNHAELVLRLTVPQAAMQRQSTDSGLAEPHLLDDGVGAVLLGYSFGGFWQGGGDAGASSQFVGLSGRANTGPWRWHWGGTAGINGGTTRWHGGRLQATRTINPWRAQLELGQVQSGGRALPSLPLLGARMFSEAGMRPTYAPHYQRVQGMAATQARVIVRQRGRIVYETVVTPGLFVLDDFVAPDRVDAEVSVEEVDGTVSSFIVPYLAPALLLAPGEWRYDTSIGKVDLAGESSLNPWLLQAEIRRGLTPTATVFGGWQGAWGGAADLAYSAVNAGFTMTSRFGVVSADVTSSDARGARLGSQHGNSLRLAYQSAIQATGGDFALAAYRFSSRNYLTLSQAVQQVGASEQATDRHRFDVMMGQPWAGGRVSARASFAQSWLPERERRSYSLQYGAQLREVFVSLSVSRSFLSSGPGPSQVGISLTMPMGPREVGRRPSGSVYTNTSSGVTDLHLGLNVPVTVAEMPISTSVSFGVNTQTMDDRVGLSAAMEIDKVALSGGVSRESKSGRSSTYLTAHGGLVLHAGGATFTRHVPQTAALVHAPGAHGASVAGETIDRHGYAITPLSPFRYNTIDVDTAGSAPDLELKTSRKHAAPSLGAVVKVPFEAREGRNMIIDGVTADGKPLPFGASVSDELGNEVGLVGQGGAIFARVRPGMTSLRVNWGRRADESCKLGLEAMASLKATSGKMARAASTCRSSLPAAVQARVR